jgi:HEAT repeat protein
VYTLASPLDQKLLAEAHATDAEAEEILEVLRARHGVPGAEKAIPRLLETKCERVVWLALRCAKDRRVAAARPQVLRRLARPEWVDSLVDVVIAVEDDACRRAYRELWQSTPPEKRTGGLVTLVARSGAPDAPGILLALLDKEPAALRYAAAAAAAELRLHEAVDRLLSPSVPAELRFHYVQSAARIVDSNDVEKLAELLGEPEEGLRNNVRCLLFNLPDRGAMRKLVDLLIHESRPAFRDRLFDVVKCGDLYLPGLLEGVPDRVVETIVREGETNAAYNCAEILLKRKGKAAVAILEEAMLASGESRAHLLQLLLDYPSERVAAAALSWLKSPWARSVIAYLEKAKTPESIPALGRTAASHPDAFVKRDAEEALSRLRGTPPPKEEWVLDSYPWYRFIDPVAEDAPGARDEIRQKVKAEGVSTYLKALSAWAHPEMIPALMDGLRSWDEGLAERVRWEGYPGPCVRSGHETYGSDWMVALAATQDRSLDPFFVERLADPDPGVRGVAIRTAGGWRILKADPQLRRLVRSASYEVRAEALEALAQIAAPGTKEFIVEHLRDNPHAAPLALARLGAVDAIPAIARLLEDPGPKAAVLSALDLLSNPQAYGGIDNAIPRFRLGQQRDWVQLLQETLKVPVRVTLPHPPDLSISSDGTYRGALENLAGMHCYYYHSDLKVTHVFRNGAVEFCSVDDAQAYWTKRLAR